MYCSRAPLTEVGSRAAVPPVVAGRCRSCTARVPPSPTLVAVPPCLLWWPAAAVHVLLEGPLTEVGSRAAVPPVVAGRCRSCTARGPPARTGPCSRRPAAQRPASSPIDPLAGHTAQTHPHSCEHTRQKHCTMVFL